MIAGSFRSRLAVAALTGALMMVVPASSQADTTEEAVQVSRSSAGQPTVGGSETITVSGTADVLTRRLRVYMLIGDEACPDLPSPAGSVEAVLGPPNVANTTVAPGSFSQPFSITFAKAGLTDICAYLGSATDEKPPSNDANGGIVLEVQTPPPPTPHLTALTVVVRSHAGHTASKPGRTELLVGATGGGELSMTLRHHGHRRVENLGYKSAGKFIVPWSCSSPSGVYSYAITAIDEYGKTLTHSGSFRPVSAARCRVLRIADTRRRAQEEHEHREEQASRERERPRIEKVKGNQREACEQLGGYVEDTNEAEHASEYETECGVGDSNVFLAGDPPRIVNTTPKLSA